MINSKRSDRFKIHTLQVSTICFKVILKGILYVIKFSIFLIMLISLLVCRAFFFASNCFAHCDMHYVDRDTLSWILLSNEPFPNIGLFRNILLLPSLYSLKKYWPPTLFVHILFNTLAHLPTPFPSPMSIDEYFEITWK